MCLKPLTFVSITSHPIVLGKKKERCVRCVEAFMMTRYQMSTTESRAESRIRIAGVEAAHMLPHISVLKLTSERMQAEMEQKWRRTHAKVSSFAFLLLFYPPEGSFSQPESVLLFFFFLSLFSFQQKVLSDCPFLCGGQQFPPCGPQ